MYRGSRKHILDWVEAPEFIPELLTLAQPIECCVTSTSLWQPVSYRRPGEARLETFGPRAFPRGVAWQSLTSWWLRHTRGANTPNWDLALSCRIDGQMGLLLVEAKANVPELKDAGKRNDPEASAASAENHEQICSAINDARVALEAHAPGITISADTHYQLSNRIAFAWKLASLGVPTVLIFLGFTGDTGIADVGEPFSDEDHWQRTFHSHLEAVCRAPLCERSIQVGPAPFWVLVRSRRVLEISPPVI